MPSWCGPDPATSRTFTKTIGPLAYPAACNGNPKDAFHVGCPSLPGYGFSDKDAQPGWGIQRIARAWVTLIGRLGYDRFGAAGSDWGTSIAASINQQDPERLTGLNLAAGPLSPSGCSGWSPRTFLPGCSVRSPSS
jgi:epoxide hydrolase